MVQALLTLYDATEDQAWLVRAQQTLTFLTSTQVFIEDIRFPGFSILGSGWYEWYGTNYCSCPGCNFAVLAAILMYNRLEQEGPSGIDLIPICPINTSTLGTSMASKVEVIRQFRDAYLLPRQSGEAFINAYYKYSPPIASYIAPREWLKAVVRIVLLPVIGFVWLFV